MKMSTLKIACIGEAMIEMIASADGTTANLGVAGDSMNTAIYLKRCLGSKHEVSFVSMVGRDTFSDRIARFIADENISTHLLKRHPKKLPGIYSISTTDTGERSFSYWREASAARLMFSCSEGLSFDELAEFDVIYASAITLAILPQSARDAFFEWIAEFRSKGGRFVFDSNFRPALWPDNQLARQEISKAWLCCDIALPSIDDEMALFDESSQEAVLHRLHGYGIASGVLKRGDLGPISLDPNFTSLPAYPKSQNVVDTTAAGDSFNGGFLSTYLTTGDLKTAAKVGHDLASLVVSYQGAIIPNDSLTTSNL